MHARTLVPALAIATALIAPSVAAADRAPTASERRAIARAVGAPARCQSIRVSTVDRTWAASTFKATKSCASFGTFGTDVVSRTKGTWAPFSGSGECTRPQRVPRRIWKDLLPSYCD